MNPTSQPAATYSNFIVLVQTAALHLVLTLLGLLVALILDHKVWGLLVIGIGTVVLILWAIGRLRREGL